MDFALTDEQQAVVDLARQILGERTTLDRLREVEAGSEWFDRDLWVELAKADLLGLTLPESVGGGGFGFLEACLLLEAQGRSVSPLPLLGTLVGAQAVAAFAGDTDWGSALLGRVVAGDATLALALAEVAGSSMAPVATTARLDGDAWVVDGEKTCVAMAHLADRLLVSVAVEGSGPGVLVVDPAAAGVELERHDTFNHEPGFRITFRGAVAEGAPLGGVGDGAQAAHGWVVDRATVGTCALAAGVAERAMRITAEYTTTRKQFDRPIGTFQAVGQRLADCYIDVEGMRLTMLSAASLLADGKGAATQVASAKWWAAEGGNRVAHAGLHVHGGISIDLDYPIHRYFLWHKHLELQLGGANQQLDTLGHLI